MAKVIELKVGFGGILEHERNLNWSMLGWASRRPEKEDKL